MKDRRLSDGCRETLKQLRYNYLNYAQDYLTCENCGSEDVRVEAYFGYTGVTAPDGYLEPDECEVVVCNQCKAREEL